MGRRFQKVCEINGFTVYDDYAHHPTEIKATLDAAALKFGKEKIVAVFQPHRYTRLKSLWNEFKNAFGNAGRIIVTDVYAASEDSIEGISGKNFASELKGSEYLSGNMQKVSAKLLPTLKSGDIVIGLGAGTITALGKELEKISLS
jgi:UDP-N-acetylmuramate--alanine ligase